MRDVSSDGVYARSPLWEKSDSYSTFWAELVAEVESETGCPVYIDAYLIRAVQQAQDLELDMHDRSVCRRVLVLAQKREKADRERQIAKQLQAAENARTWVAEQGRTDSVVYFIVVDDLVKIGTTIQTPERRMRGMQLPPSARIAAVIPNAGFQQERELHRLFEDDRVGGEWFKLTNDIQTFMDRFAVQAVA